MDDPRPSQDQPPARLPTWAFVLWVVVVLIVTWFAYFRHSLWGFLGIAALFIIAQRLRARRRPPEWSDKLDLPLRAFIPKLWAGMGWVCLVIGTVLCVVIPLVAIGWALSGDYSIAALNLFVSLPIAIEFAASGKWLIKNRRQPLAPPPAEPPS